MRAMLYRNLDPALSSPGVSAAEAQRLAPLTERAIHDNRETSAEIQWTADAASAETFHAIPLKGRDGHALGVLLIGSSRRELALLVQSIRKVGLYVGGAGALLALALVGWATARVTRPVKLLAAGAAEVARGNWRVHVETDSRDEIGDLARAFNQMTGELSDQRDRLVQAERVAAWRELARRLAHELKNPLFPLQITVENLERAKREHPGQFEEVFRESTATLLAELANLKAIIGRFSDFAKMPTPQFEPAQLNDLVRAVLKLVDAQLTASGNIHAEAHLDPALPSIEADPEQIKRALQNLVLNAMDAMPNGGTLRLTTRQYNSTVILEVADSGQGLTQEECARLFTPYYTTKHHGTGLGLAIVQSVVSDHHGTISVESQPGRGATFRLELPITQEPRS
jgi:nitrogen fixation/metabolism regulation signal transduction histidine kinase